MRVYVGAISHETNRFSPFSTTLDDYRFFPVGYDDLLKAAQAVGCDTVAGLCLRAAPSGPTRQTDYVAMRTAIVEEIRASVENLDLILLSLHGAQVADACDDCEGDILGEIRRVVGEDLPIGVLLDLHANLSPLMLKHASLITVIKEYPHTDFPATATQLVELMQRYVHEQIEPTSAFVPLPLFTMWHTPQEPSKSLLDRARALEQEPEVLHIALVHGFPWSDVVNAGASVLVTTNADEPLASRIASDFADGLWRIRQADLARYQSACDCLDEILATDPGDKPDLIADAADNPGAGAGSDATWILRDILSRDIHGVAMAMFCDRSLLSDVVQAGPGASLALTVGGRSGPLAGAPLNVQAEVICVRKNAHIDAMPGYPPIPVGSLAAIRIDGVQLVISGYREQVFGPRVFTEVGIDPSRQRLIVVKSAQHFHTRFRDICRRVFYCDSQCSRSIDFSSLPFQFRRSPIWPIDQCDASDVPAPQIFR